MQAAAALCGQQSPCQGAATLAVGAVGGRPLAGTSRAAAPCELASGDSPLRAGRSRSRPGATAAPTGGRPFTVGPWLQPASPL
ncbi:hypothetical protein GW17_00055622 [Ensete ventricosum]|nr:hypothetical protein GW17_00055622 [Ensete ventricosum]